MTATPIFVGDLLPALGEVRPALGEVRPPLGEVRPALGEVLPAGFEPKLHHNIQCCAPVATHGNAESENGARERLVDSLDSRKRPMIGM